MATKSHNNYTNETFLKSGNKTQNQVSKNSFNTTIEKPGINESALDKEKHPF